MVWFVIMVFLEREMESRRISLCFKVSMERSRIYEGGDRFLGF